MMHLFSNSAFLHSLTEINETMRQIENVKIICRGGDERLAAETEGEGLTSGDRGGCLCV